MQRPRSLCILCCERRWYQVNTCLPLVIVAWSCGLMTAYVMSYLLHRGDDDIDMFVYLVRAESRHQFEESRYLEGQGGSVSRL